METLIWLLVIGIIAGLLFVSSLLLTLYIVLCEYYELKFHYLTPKKSGMVNKSSGYSSVTIVPSAVVDGAGATSGSGGGHSRGSRGSSGGGGGGGGGGGADPAI